MEENENKYIVKLVSGNALSTGSFITKDENDVEYFSNEHFYNKNSTLFHSLVQYNPKYAVIMNEEGIGNWVGKTFRNIKFISDSEEKCVKHIELVNLEMSLKVFKMDLAEELLELHKTLGLSSRIAEINSKIIGIDEILLEVKQQVIKMQE